jgi:hypothetical protein
LSKDEKFEIGDIVEIIDPSHTQYGRRMRVSGYYGKSKHWHTLDYIDELNATQVESHSKNLKLVTRTKDAGYACGCITSTEKFKPNTWADNINKEFMTVKAAEQSVNQFNNIIKENKMATEKLTIEVDVKQLGLIGKTKKEKTPKIVCKVDGELMEFKNEEALKAFMWTSRCNEVIRYDLTGKVSVPFELTTTEVK